MMGNTYIFAGGGTGGHLYPGLAVAEALRTRQPDAKIIFACSSRDIDRTILDPTGYVSLPQPILPFPRRVTGLWAFWRAWRASLKLARECISREKPRAVLGLGGFAAGAMVRTAASQGLPTALLNPDALPGRANAYLARRVDVIFTQFASTAACFAPPLQKKVRCVGCPVRAELTAGRRDEAVEYFHLDANKKTLLIFGGSTLATSVTDAVVALAKDLGALSKAWQVIFVVGAERQAEIEAKMQEANIGGRVLAYCDRMDLAYAAADLALARGGAGTIAELTAAATPAVVMPYPHHKDRQQYHNAAELIERGAAKLVDDHCRADPNAQALRAELLPILQSPAVLEEMHRRAQIASKPTAARDVADWLTAS
ncbi:MAG: UDP-N-acetylglucosamine--N-acetylmuramyl-(pentapeptide) pyrophosphoryl-undecaprenol N-acetylglucosamine transferase [Phycisphaerae bacterium]|nr:UDP-N-acetylglucosamine--N-acetylmuramyl-(pentapeptide) pyrophosphoryl-undecaprenol N-acetylglucosamine transferase [Phycisphaerae bacterium]